MRTDTKILYGNGDVEGSHIRFNTVAARVTYAKIVKWWRRDSSDVYQIGWFMMAAAKANVYDYTTRILWLKLIHKKDVEGQ